ncbi:MAG: archaeosortase H [Promethearchaeota archaeon]
MMVNYRIKKGIFYFLTAWPALSSLIGFAFPSEGYNNSRFTIYLILLLGILIIPFFILTFRTAMPEQGQNEIKKVIVHGLFLDLVFVFSFLIGFSIPLMESHSKYNMALIMIPLLMVLTLIILKRFQLNDDDHEIEQQSLEIQENKSSMNPKGKPIIEFNGKRYSFTSKSLIIFAIGTPLLSYLTYFFFDLEFNFWLHEIVVKQTVYLLNLFFHMGVKAVYSPIGRYHWYFDIPGRPNIYFETFCTGIQAINTFVGIIVFIPHSLDEKNNRDIIWRKTKALVVSSAIFYIVNIFRMVLQLYLYYIGYAWEDIHVSISAASSFIAAIIVLMLHKWIPEFILSIIYAGILIYRKYRPTS